MKKFILIASIAFMSASAFAQLKVVSSGQVRIGNLTDTTSSTGPTIAIDNYLFRDNKNAQLRVFGNGTNKSNGKISFGESGHVAIGEKTNGKGNGMFNISAYGGILCQTGEEKIFEYDKNLLNLESNTPTFNFKCAVTAPQFLTVSDSRSKTDIEPLENMGQLLKDISPVSYRLITTGSESADGPSKAPRSNTSGQTGHHQYGFLAQDVREVYPELVYEDSEGNLSIDYTGFIPILVDAIQNLQAKVEEQSQTIEALQNPAPQTQNLNGESTVASLSQNRPNPFRTSTIINCVLPETVGNAFLCIYDLNGNQKQRHDISDRGNVDISIEGNSLTAGMYIYTLVADGIEIDSKRMILTD